MNKNLILEVSNLNKSFKKNNSSIKVLDDISFKVYEGEIISIVGSSGCGKTTLLNIISMLDDDFDGNIKRNFSKNDVAYMFQDSALFPWLTIEKNAKLGINIKKINNDKYVDKLLNKYKLYEFKDALPSSLSGGMKQRVSLIRTISQNPKVLFLDEPFAALDYQSRLSISKDIYEEAKDKGITIILITHDIAEAVAMSDRVIVLSQRPAKIKNIYNIDLENKINPIANRSDIHFQRYYTLIGKDLDIFE